MIVLGIGEMAVSDKKGEKIKTFALGSCVALSIYDPKTRTSGLVHIALPTAKVNRRKAIEQPGHFADTAVPELFKQMKEMGSKPPYKHFVIKIIGGASMAHINDVFKIGQRNLLEVKKQLWKMGLYPTKEDVGDTLSRSVTMDVESGILTVSAAGRGTWTL